MGAVKYLKISVVDVKVIKTDGKLRLREIQGTPRPKNKCGRCKTNENRWKTTIPVLGATLGCLSGNGGFPKGARRLPRENPRRPKPFPWSASGLPFGAGPPEGGRGPQGDNPGDPKGASRRRGAQVLEKYQKTMSISLRRNVHAVEARSPY